MASSLVLKRKLSREDDQLTDYTPAKQLKVATAPLTQSNEVAMSDNDVHHLINVVPFPSFTAFSTSQLSINTTSSPNYRLSSLSSPPSPSSAYPVFDLYPEIETPMDIDLDSSASSAPHHHHHSNSPSLDSAAPRQGLLQPSTSSLQHGDGCTTIPRLRMSSHAGLNGYRTMWSHCESCGAIEMVSA